MSWIGKLHKFLGRSAAGETSDELQFHLEKEIEQNISRGMSPAEAHRRALIALGGVQQTREQVRETHWSHFLETIFQDLRFGVRMLIKGPGFALAAVLTLALGIGANAYIFSFADAVLVRPLAFPRLDRLMTLFTFQKGSLGRLVTPADFLDWRRQNQSFESLCGFSAGKFNITGGDGAEKASGSMVTANFFSTLGVSPQLGRGFSSDEDQPGHDQVVVLSYGLWTRRYGSDPSIVGRDIELNGRPYKVVGVAGKTLDFPTVDLWTPLAWTDAMTAERNIASLEAVGRLKPGITESQADAEMKGIAQQLAVGYPDTDKEKSVVVRPLRLVVNGTMCLPMTEALALAAALVLLLACANVAGLLIARGISRQREMAVRAALGARRRRLVRQLLIENVLLATLGCVTAFGLAKWAVAAQLASFSPVFVRLVNGLGQISVDARAFLFMLAITIISVFAFGIVPAFGTTRLDLNSSLREGGQSSASRSRHALRSAMVTLQVALALALLAGALLMSRGFHEVATSARNLGPEEVLTFTLQLPESKYAGSAEQAQLYDRAVDNLSQVPGAISVAAFTSTPFSNNGVSWITFRPDNQPSRKSSELPGGIIQSISPGFFATMRIPLMGGRDFSLQDKADHQQVVIINQRLAQRFWHGENPIGKTLQVEDGKIVSPWLTVVGVAQDMLYDWTNQIPEFAVYRPFAEAPRKTSLIAIRAAGNPLSLVPAARKAISAIDHDLPVGDVQTLAQDISDSVTPLAWIGGFVEALGLLALVLALVGVYGVMANAVNERRREIGIRIALGASRARVLAMILRKSMLLTLAGIVLGFPLALALDRMLASISYGVRSTETLMLLVCALMLLTVAFVACIVPARRASRIDPLATLRYE